MAETKIIKKEYTLTGLNKKPITLDVTYNERSENTALMIFCHGFKGFKDWGAFNQMAKKFAEQNFFFVKFNFSHNGTTPSDFSDINDLEAFGQNNFELELDDLNRVLSWLDSEKNEFAKCYNRSEIFAIGHSRGGGIVMLKATEDARIKKVVTWASVNDFEKYMYLSDAEKWKTSGVSFVENARTGVKLPLYYQFYENFYKNSDRFDIKEHVVKMEKPILMIHGDEDEVVDIQDSQWIYDNLDHSILVKIEGGNHTFGAKHPWIEETLPENLNFAIEETIEFLTF